MSNNSNTNNKKPHNERKLQHTSRITPKIREYLAELASERELELERFMALSSSSPASSSISVGVGVGAHASRCHSRSRSRSSVDSTGVATAAMACMRNAVRCTAPAKVTNIPISMAATASSRRTASASAEDLRTPTKGTQTPTPQMHTRKTQTPESALKSHKRLEWDPAADVGYRSERAASVSNISTLERSVLEAAMQPAPRAEATRSNQSESDLNRLQQQQQQQQQQLVLPPAPPLASSTFVRPPTTTPVPSQSSRRESCATSAVSSFDYQQNSRPSTSHSHSQSHSQSQSQSCSSSRHTLSAEELLRHVAQQREEREYAAKLEQVLCRRRRNKENEEPRDKSSASTSSSSCPAPTGGKCDLDLGIDLLCSLVSKRSLSYGQKKQLIRDIAKRLACIDLVASSADSSRSSRRSKRVSQAPSLKEDTPSQRSSRRQDTATSTSKSYSPDLAEQGTLQVVQTAPTAAPTPAPTPSSSPLATSLPTSLPVPAPRTRLATPTQSPLPCSYASTSSGASNELVTQKTNLQVNSKPGSVSNDAMQNWLNPMTQSEIDYEAKRLDTERRTQLNWIETEIQRLRTLQNLLTTAAKGILEPPPAPNSNKSVRIPIQLIPKELPAEVPPPAEGSSLNKLSAAAAAATALVVRRPAPPAPPPPAPPLPPPAAVAPAAAAPPVHRRSKMATPNNSGSSESVCSFVQQRQRQFMVHYQNQQQQRLEQQQQQQQQRQQQQQQQQQLLYRQQLLHASCHMHQCQHLEQQQQHHYMQMQYAQAVGNACGCLDEGGVYYQVVNSHNAHCYAHAVEPPTAAAAAAATTTTAAATTTTTTTAAGSNSTSSMLCISSEMSIPMGLTKASEATTTTTTTTTHQYDDVACQQQLQRIPQQQHQQQQQQQQQLMLQVRPRGIAYVIQFSSNGDASEILSDALTLQDHLQRARPLFCAQSKQRKAILNEMQLLRNERRRELEQLIGDSSVNTLDRRLQQLPPPATSRVRIFSTREMKALTSKRCESLPEVLAAQNREREERRRRSNRLMRDVFNRRLQRRVRKGKLSLNHSRTVI